MLLGEFNHAGFSMGLVGGGRFPSVDPSEPRAFARHAALVLPVALLRACLNRFARSSFFKQARQPIIIDCGYLRALEGLMVGLTRINCSEHRVGSSGISSDLSRKLAQFL